MTIPSWYPNQALRERRREQDERTHVWMVHNKFGQAKLGRCTWWRSEAEALVAALEAAPRREPIA